jgi:hypothetical protein
VAAVGTTALTHLIFFGAGRYALVCYAAVAALSGCALRRPGSFLTGGEAARDTAASEEPDAADRD